MKAICYKWKGALKSGTLVMKKVDKVWHIFAATLSDTEPAAGDYVTDDEGNSWTIMDWHLEEIGLSLIAYR